MLKIHVPYDEPYREVISNLLVDEFPQMNGNNAEQTLDYLTTAILATNQIRYGPMPKPEAMVEIRKTIRNAIANSEPIPILMPWGSRKTQLRETIDLAEVAALKTLACLQTRVTARYEPGVNINIRVEDASGNYLFEDDGEVSRMYTKKYTKEFVDLVKVLGYGNFLNPILESQLFTEEEFKSTSGVIEPFLIDYIQESDGLGFGESHDFDTNLPSYKKLVEMGWQGGIPVAQRNYYRDRYNRLYPGATYAENTIRLTRYLAGAWARRKLNGYGDNPIWNKDYLRLTFAAPVPGAPGAYSKDIFYRTLPAKLATTHISPWRAKGFIQITEEEATPKITNWNDPKDYVSLSITISDNDTEVQVKSDYVLV